MTKIDIFSGFLGAGKTTLIKKLIKEAYSGEKLVLIENEFGEIGIDGGFMQDAGIEVNEMNSGCICCSLVGDFAEALKKVLHDYSPDRILIEPSGVGKLSDVIRAVEGVTDENTVLNSYCAVVDAKKCKMYMKNFGEFFNDQIETASCIILSHTDGVSEDKLSECVSLIKEHNADAQIVTTPWDELGGQAILSVIEKTDTLETEIEKLKGEHHHHDEECHCHDHHHHDEECHCHDHHHHHHHEEECHCHEHEHHHNEECHCHDHEHHHHHHHADDVFTSWGCETVRTYTQDEIRSALDALSKEDVYGTILRAKGIVKGADEWIHFDYVPGEADVRTGSASAIGRICVIGSGINEDAIKQLF
ncbi:MAG: GTP-binding protein [Clostridia bacterium]|nr:GTP-binding protein [Clostridia bacterium]